ncbi:unnamed protein product [Owenia fusiformis]|uniref:C2H2-type domain-containing protein n=1 Tax=Owenia fusiformis TaxID=6347 RepID=A0A8S4PC96_OWEFU|nr:unnamed protein product [Owenia fusiformis]
MLYKHARIAHGLVKALRCPQCGKYCKYFSEFERHLFFHTESTSCECRICGLKLSIPGSLRRHEKLHLQSDKPHCDQCGKSFGDLRGLSDHVNVVHLKLVKFTCVVCNRGFATKKFYRRHLESHTKPYQCDQCGRKFTRSEHLKSHEGVHNGEYPYKCKLCDAGFRENRALRKHLDKEHGVELPKFASGKVK